MVLTSGLGEMYPEGLVVGKVARVERKDADPFQAAVVEPAVEMDKLERLYVLADTRQVSPLRFLDRGGAVGVRGAAAIGLGPSLPLVRGRPDLVLVVVLAWAMLRGSIEGAIVGFLGGMLLDSVTYTPFGINTALFGLIGYCAGLPEVNVYRGNLPYFLGHQRRWRRSRTTRCTS